MKCRFVNCNADVQKINKSYSWDSTIQNKTIFVGKFEAIKCEQCSEEEFTPKGESDLVNMTKKMGIWQEISLTCPCGGKLEIIDYEYFYPEEGESEQKISLGIFKAEKCDSCEDIWFPEETSKQIEKVAKEKGVWEKQ